MNSAEEMKIKQYLSKYQHPDTTRKDVLNTLKQYRGLIAKLENFMFNDGSSKELVNVQGTIPVSYKDHYPDVLQEKTVFSNGTTKQLCQLSGTIPVPFKGNVYNIPVIIWLMDTHPNNAPICYVNPTPDMEIKVSMYVDHNGKIYLPYLHDWVPNNSDLLGVIQVMICTFGERPPVYAKPKENSAPYPTGQQFRLPGPNTSQTPAYPPYPSRPLMPGPPSSNSGFPTFTPPYPLAPGTDIPGPPSSGFPSYPPPYPLQTGKNYPSYPGYPSYPSYAPAPNANSANTGSGGGTISEEHIRASLLSAVEDKLRRRMKEHLSQAQAELETLHRTQQELTQGRTKLEEMLRRLEQEQIDLDKSIGLLRDKEQELEKAITHLAEQEPIDVDEAVTTTAPLYKQLLNAFTEEAATEDAIYYMGEALRRGVIDLDVFLKQIRQLSRKQFMLRALMQKCRQKAGLAG